VIKPHDEVVRNVVVASVVVASVVVASVVVADIAGSAVVCVGVVNGTVDSTDEFVVYCVVNFVVVGGMFMQSTRSACSQNF